MNGFMCHLIRETSLVVFPLNASFATGEIQIHFILNCNKPNIIIIIIIHRHRHVVEYLFLQSV